MFTSVRFHVLCILLVLPLSAAGGDKTGFNLTIDGRRYEVPPFAINGKTLTVASEKEKTVNYSAPFGARSSDCRLHLKANRQGNPRFDHYGEFSLFKAFVADEVKSGDGQVLGQPCEKAEILAEERYWQIVSITRTLQKRLVVTVSALVMAGDLLLQLDVSMFEKREPAQEQEALRSLRAWAERVVKANRPLPLELPIERGGVRISVPYPFGRERFVPGDSSNDGGFISSARPLPATARSGDASGCGLPRFPELEERVTGQGEFDALGDEILDRLDGYTFVKRGKRHFMVRETGRVLDFVLVKKQLVVLSHARESSGDNQERILDDWRRELFKTNSEVPE